MPFRRTGIGRASLLYVSSRAPEEYHIGWIPLGRTCTYRASLLYVCTCEFEDFGTVWRTWDTPYTCTACHRCELKGGAADDHSEWTRLSKCHTWTVSLLLQQNKHIIQILYCILLVKIKKLKLFEGSQDPGVLGPISFPGYVPQASQNPYPFYNIFLVYLGRVYRPNVSHFWAL